MRGDSTRPVRRPQSFDASAGPNPDRKRQHCRALRPGGSPFFHRPQWTNGLRYHDRSTRRHGGGARWESMYLSLYGSSVRSQPPSDRSMRYLRHDVTIRNPPPGAIETVLLDTGRRPAQAEAPGFVASAIDHTAYDLWKLGNAAAALSLGYDVSTALLQCLAHRSATLMNRESLRFVVGKNRSRRRRLHRKRVFESVFAVDTFVSSSTPATQTDRLTLPPSTGAVSRLDNRSLVPPV